MLNKSCFTDGYLVLMLYGIKNDAKTQGSVVHRPTCLQHHPVLYTCWLHWVVLLYTYCTHVVHMLANTG